MRAVRVARDGVRIAVVSAGADGVQVDVAAITRDESGAPQQLGSPVRAGASLVDASSVVWSEESTLAVVGRSVGNAAVHLVPVAGPTQGAARGREPGRPRREHGHLRHDDRRRAAQVRRLHLGADPGRDGCVVPVLPGLTSRPQPTVVPTRRTGSAPSARMLAPMTFLRELLGLLVPVECAGCGTDDVAWCPSCARRLAGGLWRCEDRAPRLDRMDGPDRCRCGRSPTAPATSAARSSPGRTAGGSTSRARSRPPSQAPPAGCAPTSVPGRCWSCPARRRPRRADAGAATSWTRSRRASRTVSLHGGVPAEAAPVLVRTRGHDQVGLGARERSTQPRRPRPGADAARGATGGPARPRRGRRADHRRDRRRVPLRARARRCPGRRRRDARVDPRSARRAAAATPSRRVHRVIRGSGGWFADGCGVSVGS